jgi:hypothetical protein
VDTCSRHGEARNTHKSLAGTPNYIGYVTLDGGITLQFVIYEQVIIK